MQMSLSMRQNDSVEVQDVDGSDDGEDAVDDEDQGSGEDEEVGV